jgi:hypothetical protein
MTYRPYPSPDRARHQLDRHDDETPPLTARRPLSPMEQTLVDHATHAVRSAAPALAAMVAGFQRRPAGSEETSG